MATAHGSLQDRLRRAFVHHICSIMPARDLPDGLREEHEALLARLRRGGDAPGADGPIAATCAVLSDEEASEVAEEVLYLEYRIRSLSSAPPWHYVGRPTTLMRVLPEPSDPEPNIQGSGAN